jgi:transcriptional regulator with XRE-family HTH domain
VTSVSAANPTVARRELAVYFRQLREQHELSLEAIADELVISVSHASRLDTGARTVQPGDVRRLAGLYHLSDQERDRLLALARSARRRSWWQQVTLPPSYRTYVGMEQDALAVNEYCSAYVPGLLQTPEYMAEAAAAQQVPEDLRAAVADVRRRRQEILERPDPPQLWVILDEVVLARGVHDPDVMRAQIEHLCSAAEHPGITIQVIDFAHGIYPQPLGHLILLEMPKPLPDVQYYEDWVRYIDSSDDTAVRQARATWKSLHAVALSPRSSLEVLERYLKELKHPHERTSPA